MFDRQYCQLGTLSQSHVDAPNVTARSLDWIFAMEDFTAIDAAFGR